MWNTLVDAYKKIKDNNNKSTGRGSMHFKYLNEMDALLGANHDAEIPVVGTSEGLHIPRPNVIIVEGTQSPAPSQPSQSLQGGTSRHRVRRKD